MTLDFQNNTNIFRCYKVKTVEGLETISKFIYDKQTGKFLPITSFNCRQTLSKSYVLEVGNTENDIFHLYRITIDNYSDVFKEPENRNCYIYDSEERFVVDLINTRNKQVKLLEDYKLRLQKKQDDVDFLVQFEKQFKNKFPEVFI